MADYCVVRVRSSTTVAGFSVEPGGGAMSFCITVLLGNLDSTRSMPSAVISYSLLKLNSTYFFCRRYHSVNIRCSRGNDINVSICSTDMLDSSHAVLRRL